MKSFRCSDGIVFLALLASLSNGRASADEFRFEPLTVPQALLEKGKVNLVIEASAVEPIDDHLVVIAHDKAAALHVLDIGTGELREKALNSPRFPSTSKSGPKWEAMTRDADGNFYLIGSHSGKTEAERAEKTDLIRFRLKNDAAGNPTIDDASVARWSIAAALESAVKQHAGARGVEKRKVEGLTFRERDGRKELLVGLREPGDAVRVFTVDITQPPAASAALPIEGLAFSFKADDREGVPSQLTSLQHVPELDGFLVVTASEDNENVFHGNTLWFVPDSQQSKTVKIATFEVAMKAEGLAVLKTERTGPKATAIDLLITYDNDPHATKIPSRFQRVRLTHRKP